MYKANQIAMGVIWFVAQYSKIQQIHEFMLSGFSTNDEIVRILPDVKFLLELAIEVDSIMDGEFESRASNCFILSLNSSISHVSPTHKEV